MTALFWQHPLMCVSSLPGGIGVIGGVTLAPRFLEALIKELKSYLADKNAPFGVDLLIPQIGGSARKTNVDYTGGQLPELIDVIIKGGASLFVSAVGVPPKWAVDKLHNAGIVVMKYVSIWMRYRDIYLLEPCVFSMVGHPKVTSPSNPIRDELTES